MQTSNFLMYSFHDDFIFGPHASILPRNLLVNTGTVRETAGNEELSANDTSSWDPK